MSLTRIYQSITLSESNILGLDEKASHHLARVLRMKCGDDIILFNGDGHDYLATIIRIDKKIVTAEITKKIKRDVESPRDIYLAQGIARGEKMDFIVQKAVELGCKKIFPLMTSRSNVRLNEEREAKRLEHWQSVVISACEQSSRNVLPEIFKPKSFDEWLDEIKIKRAYVLSPHVKARLQDVPLAENEPILLLIGPEGGLSDEEVERAIKKGFLPLNLGPRILRTETATIAAISVLQYLYGDFS